MRHLSFLLLFLLSQNLHAQHPHPHSRAINFPDIPGYQTLVCDLHIHTVFSDGSVWPDIRVQEALRDSVDAISLTEHLEYQPHADDMPHPDRNRAHELAEKYAKAHKLIVIPGSEITRDLPPGHANAIFIQDANKLLLDDPLDVYREAKRQGAFTFWNHPNWVGQRKDGIATLTDLHRQLIEEKLLDGIEVVNEMTYSDEALQIALDHDLCILGTSDIHGLVDWQFNLAEGGHRPVTFVFSETQTAEGIKAGLENRRTVVWFNNLLIGREEWLAPLLHASMLVKKAGYDGLRSIANVYLKNDSDAEFILMNESGYTLHAHADVVTLPPHSTTKVEVKTMEQLESFELKFRVLNAVTAPGTHPAVAWQIVLE